MALVNMNKKLILLIFELIVIIGVFGPWLSVCLKTEIVKNSITGKIETYCVEKSVLSPFYASLIKKGEIIDILWFISFNTLCSGSLILLGMTLFCFKYHNKWISISSFLIAFFGLILFFFSLGSGLSIGMSTNVEWGLFVTISGIFLMFIFYLYDKLSNIRSI